MKSWFCPLILVLLGCSVFINAQQPMYNRGFPQQSRPIFYGGMQYPPLKYQPMQYPPLQYRPMPYQSPFPPPPEEKDPLPWFIPRSYLEEESDLRRAVLQIDDVMAAAMLASSNPLEVLSGVSQLYSSFTATPESSPQKGLNSAFDVRDISGTTEPWVIFVNLLSLFLTFTD